MACNQINFKDRKKNSEVENVENACSRLRKTNLVKNTVPLLNNFTVYLMQETICSLVKT
jgi:hypothetical protein